MSNTRPVLRYHGGKFRLAPWILTFFPEHRIYVEPFAGAASVLMLKPRAPSEVYNDLDSRIVNVFRVLRDRDKAAELMRRVELTPFAREEFEASYDEPVDDIDAAHKTIVRAFMGHGSDSATRGCKTGFRAKCHDRALPSQEWSRWPSSIPAFTERLRGVVVEHRDAIEIIQRYDSPETLIYADPPYLFSTRCDRAAAHSHGYRHEMTDTEHRRLADALRGCRAMVVLSGYPSELYDGELYRDWERFERRHTADGGKGSTEAIWVNPACSAALRGVNERLFA